MESTNKPFLIAVVLFIAAAVILTVLDVRQKVVIFKSGKRAPIETSLVTAEMLSGKGTKTIILPSRGYVETIHIQTISVSDFSLKLISKGETKPADSVLTFRDRHEACAREEGSSAIVCNLITLNPNHERLYRVHGDTTAIDQIKFSIVKEKRAVAIPDDSELLIRIGLFILIMLPLVWLSHHLRSLSQWIIVGTAIVAIGMINLHFTVALLIVLVTTFILNSLYVRGANPKWFLLSSLILSFTFLISFKYGQEFLHTVFVDLGRFGLALPLGISYFVIRVVDTQLKWYRKEIKGITLREYLCFVIFPATIPAGPIDTLDNFHKNRLKRISIDDIAMGSGRIVFGLFKKLVIADFLIFPQLYDGPDSLFYEVTLNIGEVAYAPLFCLLFGNFLFAYIDFSAYSDMAIGLSRLFGYRMIENFNLPILAHSIREYWRRWHLSLSMWCMRNIYFPLMVKSRHRYVPLYAVMTAVGLWHMLNLSWFTWAMHHATCLAAYAYFDGNMAKGRGSAWLPAPMKRVLGICLTLFVVSAGHSFVVFADYSYAVQSYLTIMGLR